MNHGDTFILDVRSHIFVWTGKDSNRMERLQASKVDLVPNFHVTLLGGEYHAWLYCTDWGYETSSRKWNRGRSGLHQLG